MWKALFVLLLAMLMTPMESKVKKIRMKSGSNCYRRFWAQTVHPNCPPMVATFQSRKDQLKVEELSMNKLLKLDSDCACQDGQVCCPQVDFDDRDPYQWRCKAKLAQNVREHGKRCPSVTKKDRIKCLTTKKISCSHRNHCPAGQICCLVKENEEFCEQKCVNAVLRKKGGKRSGKGKRAKLT